MSTTSFPFKLAPRTEACRECGEPAPTTGFCITGTLYLPDTGGFVLASRCHGRWQLRNFESLWRRCAPYGRARK